MAEERSVLPAPTVFHHSYNPLYNIWFNNIKLKMFNCLSVNVQYDNTWVQSFSSNSSYNRNKNSLISQKLKLGILRQYNSKISHEYVPHHVIGLRFVPFNFDNFFNYSLSHLGMFFDWFLTNFQDFSFLHIYHFSATELRITWKQELRKQKDCIVHAQKKMPRAVRGRKRVPSWRIKWWDILANFDNKQEYSAFPWSFLSSPSQIQNTKCFFFCSLLHYMYNSNETFKQSVSWRKDFLSQFSGLRIHLCTLIRYVVGLGQILHDDAWWMNSEGVLWA